MPRLTTSAKLKLAYVGIAAVDAFLAGCTDHRAHKARVLTKPLLMPTLMASLITDENAVDSPLRTSTLAAQTGGWGGDLALMGDGSTNFLLGSGSFALGHAAYISGFVANRSKTRLPGPKAVAALWATTTPGMVYGAAKIDTKLGPAIAGYAAMLATTVATATQLDPSIGKKARRRTIAGAALFMISDSILGTRKFLLKNPPPRIESAVMATYTGAQLLLSQGAAAAVRA